MYRICESSRASSFLAAVNFFQDIVFNRTCDLQDPCSVFKADIYYHNECITINICMNMTHAVRHNP